VTVSLQRFAIYFAPREHDDWARFGERALLGEARRYGFHATLKAPFRLADGARIEDLCAELDDWCATQDAFALPPLRAARLDDFFALVPARPEPRLSAVADECARRFERFRAPLSAQELAKRLARPLSARQRELLERWGYPHVFDQYRFHMSLTGPIPGHATPRFAPLPSAPLRVDSIGVFEEPAPGANFRLIHRAALRAGGRLIYVIGPSGAGKDSVIDWAKTRVPRRAGVRFAQREITRPMAESGERHLPIRRGQFALRRAQGGYAMAWEANGHLYGIDNEIREWLAAGLTVVVNGSREYLPRALRDFPGMEVVHVTAPESVLRARLLARGREEAAAVQDRLIRGARLDPPENAVRKQLVNDGDVATAGRQLLEYLQG
jgi:ribose 1,5-bisphosphokinase